MHPYIVTTLLRHSMFLVSRQVFVSYGDSWKSQTHNFVCCSSESVLVFCKFLTFLFLICFTWFTGIVKAWERHVIMWRELIKFSTLRPALLHFDFHLHCSLLSQKQFSQINLSKKVDFGTASGRRDLSRSWFLIQVFWWRLRRSQAWRRDISIAAVNFWPNVIL